MSVPDHPYRRLIEEVCIDTKPVPPDVLEAMVWIESGFNPESRSVSDARGLCQLIPRWHAAGVGVQVARYMGKPLTDSLWYDPEFSLRAGALHLRWCYTSDGSRSWERAVRKYHLGTADPAPGAADGQGTTSDQHITKFRAALTAIRNEGKTMALPIKRRLMPTTNRNYPGTPLNDTGDLYIMVHETGNTAPGATAEMHANFVVNGGGSSSVAFHLTVDEREAWQMMKLNQAGWHASDGCDNRTTDWGCFRSVAIETCVNSNNIYKVQTRKNLAELIARILMGDPAIDFGGVDPKRFSVDRIRTHNDAAYDGKWCPTYMLNDRYIPILRIDVAGRISGIPVPPAKTISIGDTVKATDVLNVRGGAGTGWVLRYQLQPGEQAYIKAGPKVADGYVWYDVVHTTKGPGWAVADWLEVVEPPKPAPAPVYAKPSIVPELAALRREDKDTAAALILKNGVDFFTVWDHVEATRDTTPFQFAYDGSKAIGATIKKGERRWVSHAFRADNKKGYYYDEHAARLLIDHFKRIED